MTDSPRYSVEYSPRAAKQLNKAPAAIRERILVATDRLAYEPRPRGCVKLTNADNHYRIRVGGWRVIYFIADSVLQVSVVRVGDRRDVYRP